MGGPDGVKVQDECGCIPHCDWLSLCHGDIGTIYLLVVRAQPSDRGEEVGGDCTGKGILLTSRQGVSRARYIHSMNQLCGGSGKERGGGGGGGRI